MPATPHRCQVPPCRNQVPPGMLVCDDDGNALALELLFVPSLALALESAHAKALKFGASRVGGRPGVDESPVPYNARATTATRDLVDALRSWADVIAAERGFARPLDTLPSLGPWLARQVTYLRSSPMGPEAVVKISGAIRQASGVVDRPADLNYAGPCTGRVLVDPEGDPTLTRECGEHLYGTARRAEVTCPACGATYPLAERRTWLLRKAEDVVAPATELARAVHGLGVSVTPSMIRNWHRRGLLPHRDVRRRVGLSGTVIEVPLYRVGDVLEKVNADSIARRESA